MGLDWVLVAPPRPEHAERFAALSRSLTAAEELLGEKNAALNTWRRFLQPGLRRDAERLAAQCEQLQAERASLVVDAADAAGAPRIGRDEAANAWVRENFVDLANQECMKQVTIGADGTMTSVGGDPSTSPDQYIARHAGVAVADLATERDARPAWIGSPGAGAFAFRGKALLDLGLDAALEERCFSSMSAAEAAALADDLARAHIAPASGTKNVLKDGVVDAVPVHDDELHATRDAAVRWLRFWSSRGFGVFAWF